MLKKIARRRGASEFAFTLVEVLVVMTIIGVLAAIAIPSLSDNKNAARAANAKSDVRNLHTSLTAQKLNGGMDYTKWSAYDAALTEANLKNEIVSGKNTFGFCGAKDEYAVFSSTALKNFKRFYASSTGGGVQEVPEAPGISVETGSVICRVILPQYTEVFWAHNPNNGGGG